MHGVVRGTKEPGFESHWTLRHYVSFNHCCIFRIRTKIQPQQIPTSSDGQEELLYIWAFPRPNFGPQIIFPKIRQAGDDGRVSEWMDYSLGIILLAANSRYSIISLLDFTPKNRTKCCRLLWALAALTSLHTHLPPSWPPSSLRNKLLSPCPGELNRVKLRLFCKVLQSRAHPQLPPTLAVLLLWWWARIVATGEAEGRCRKRTEQGSIYVRARRPKQN